MIDFQGIACQQKFFKTSTRGFVSSKFYLFACCTSLFTRHRQRWKIICLAKYVSFGSQSLDPLGLRAILHLQPLYDWFLCRCCAGDDLWNLGEYVTQTHTTRRTTMICHNIELKHFLCGFDGKQFLASKVPPMFRCQVAHGCATS